MLRKLSTIGLSVLLVNATSVSWAADVGTAINYQGYLLDAGSPANGQYDLAFRVYDDAVGGTLIAGPLFIADVDVADGVFTVAPDFGADVFGPDARWIELGVRPGASVGGYTALTPRQQALPAPVALYATNTFWYANGNDIANTNNAQVGIGYDDPTAKLEVQASSGLLVPATVMRLRTKQAIGNVTSLLEFKNTAVNAYSDVSGTTNDSTLNLNAASSGNVLIANGGGDVGVGETTPDGRLHVYASNSAFDAPRALRLETFQDPSSFVFHTALDFEGGQINSRNLDDGGGSTLHLNWATNGNVTLAHGGGDVGVGFNSAFTKLHVRNGAVTGFDSSDLNSDDVAIESPNAWLGLYSDDEGGAGSGIVLAEVDGSITNKWSIYRRTTGNVGDLNFTYGSDTNPTANEKILQLLPDGTTKVQVLEITGADVAERFPVNDTNTPGMVVMIDENNAGQLCLAKGAYNKRVAGVISGAGDLPVGAVLGNLPGTNKDEAPPIALSGRVWVHCDTTANAITPGDLLTTADRPGHAMKAADASRSHGAVIGKAMTALEQGSTGLVLVLVNLQ